MSNNREPREATTDRTTRPLLALLTVLAGILYWWGLSRGESHYYYRAAVHTMSTDWSAFLFGALDPALSITIDKAAGGLWAQALFVRVLGFHTWALLLPGALAATATVPLLFGTVRRWAGRTAAVLAALVVVLSPVAFATMRVNLADSVLMCCLAAAGYLMTRHLTDGRLRWLLAAAVLAGLAFQVKMLAGWLVLPAMVVAILVRPVSGRLVRAGVFLGVAVGVSLSWLVTVSLVAPADRPYVDGSTANSFWEMVFRYNGIGRAEGSAPSAPYGGEPGPGRLLNEQLGGQIGWLLPLAGLLLAVAWWANRRDARWALYGTWLLTGAAALSLLDGLHPYYATIIVPPLAAVTGAGAVTVWRSRARPVLPAGLALSAAAGVLIVSRTGPGWLVALLVTSGVAAVLLWAAPRTRRAALTLGAVAVLIGPATWIAITPPVSRNSMHTANPVAGPQVAETVFGHHDPRITLALIMGMPPTGPVPPIDAPLPGADINPRLLGYLLAHHRGERYLFGTGDASTASPYLEAGHRVLPMGGFTGFSSFPSRDEVTHMVRSGQLRYLYLVAAPGLPGVLGERAAWARTHCAEVPPPDYGGHPGGMALFDCIPPA